MHFFRVGPLSLVLLAVLCAAQDHNANPFGESYLIRPGDELRIIVAGEPELSGSLCVRTDGTITIALVGSIQAAGLTVRQLQVNLAKKLGEFVEAPQVEALLSHKVVPPAWPRKWLTPPERPAPFPLPEPNYRS